MFPLICWFEFLIILTMKTGVQEEPYGSDTGTEIN
jgi:hypothetical protein